MSTHIAESLLDITPLCGEVYASPVVAKDYRWPDNIHNLCPGCWNKMDEVLQARFNCGPDAVCVTIQLDAKVIQPLGTSLDDTAEQFIAWLQSTIKQYPGCYDIDVQELPQM